VIFGSVSTESEFDFESYLMRSADHGATFSAPLAIASPVPMGTIQLVSFGVADIANTTLMPYAAIDTNSYTTKQIGIVEVPHGSTTMTDPSPLSPVTSSGNKGFPMFAGTKQTQCLVFVQGDAAHHRHAFATRSTDLGNTFAMPAPLEPSPADDAQLTVTSD